MQIDKVGRRWIARSTYEERSIPKGAGFRWDAQQRYWYTEREENALKLSSPEELQRREESSRATDANVDIPCPEGLSYLAYQKAGIMYAKTRKHTLIADEMGLGKTIQALGVINADSSIQYVLVICPASLRINWRREAEKWLVRPVELTIINYDILRKNREMLHSRTWDLLILDESHYLKNPRAQRTQQVFGKWDRNPIKAHPPIPAKRVLALTGTPILNRPIELWPLLSYAGVFRNWRHYAIRYCAAYQNRFGWDVSGASNLEELQQTLRRELMVRRLKKDVLTELPSKRRQVIELPPNGCQGVVDQENAAYQSHEAALAELKAAVELSKASDNPADYQEAVKRLQASTRTMFTEISRLRHETALAKVEMISEFVKDQLETSGKLILFAHHLDVITKYVEALAEFHPVKLDGTMSAEERDRSVNQFQTNPETRVFVGSIHAAGMGLTLTAASHVVFAELDWTPALITQAEDRAHRIGQTESVLVQHLVLDGSLDARMAHILIEKQEIIDKALDDRSTLEEPAVPASKAHVTVTKKELEAPALSPEVVDAAHQALKLLSHLDGDYARDLNSIGFNKIDTLIGHSLAEASRLTQKQAVIALKLARKYRRQLPEWITKLLTYACN